MAIFSNSWTGRRDELVALMTKPPVTSTKIAPKIQSAFDEAGLKEYADLAALAGVRSPDLAVEQFKAFLNQHDIPVFNLQEVIDYMDKKAEAESKNKSGWEWKPLREKDHIKGLTFGQEGFHSRNSGSEERKSFSDFYSGPRDEFRRGSEFRTEGVYTMPSRQPVYDRTIPHHALKKVVMIEKEFSQLVSFFVSDYAPELKIVEYPDPFLMAVINNPRVAKGEGRFVIDFWDEPGFGLEQQLK